MLLQISAVTNGIAQLNDLNNLPSFLKYPQIISLIIAELCDAATRIQSAFRGHLQRKLQTSDIKDDKDLEEITKKVAEELDIDLTDPELNKAATKIQASFRGYKTRKHDE